MNIMEDIEVIVKIKQRMAQRAPTMNYPPKEFERGDKKIGAPA